MELKTYSHSVGQNAFHLVWKPKYAWDCFKFPWVRDDCDKFLREAAQKYGITIHELKVMPDHVHCFVSIPPSMAVWKALQLLKGYSSYKLMHKQKWLRSYFRKGHFWSPGKFFRSVGDVSAGVIEHYISQSNQWHIARDRQKTLTQGYHGL